MFKLLYYAISLVACFPIMLWSAITSLIMFEVRYWDDCMQCVSDILNIVDDNPRKPKTF